MKNYWLRVGCFLTGYKYDIIKGCSELAAKRVKRFTSAVLIIAIIWGFIGYAFSARYLKTEWYFSLLGALITLFVVVQIERIIILSPRGRIWPMIFRVFIGLAMAVIGSIIIDQIMFKEDIEKEKLFADGRKVEELFKRRSAEYRRQILDIDSVISSKENERFGLNEEIAKRPKYTYYTRQVRTEKVSDSVANEVVTTTATQQDNPKILMVRSIDVQLEKLRGQKQAKEDLLLNLLPIVEEDIKRNTGFLNELEILLIILAKSPIARGVWILWFVILIVLESLVLVGKLGERETDYDARLQQQMDLHFRRIELLGRQ